MFQGVKNPPWLIVLQIKERQDILSPSITAEARFTLRGDRGSPF